RDSMHLRRCAQRPGHPSQVPHPSAPDWDPLHAKCDLIASLLNPNRSFSATIGHKTEITSEFVLVFNAFGAMMGGKGALQGIKTERNGEPVRRKVDRRGSWKRRLEAALRTAWRRAYWPVLPSSRTAWREACSIRTGPSSITCADPVPSGTPNTSGHPSDIRRCQPLCACAPSADGAEDSGIRLEIASFAAPCAAGPRNAGLKLRREPHCGGTRFRVCYRRALRPS